MVATVVFVKSASCHGGVCQERWPRPTGGGAPAWTLFFLSSLFTLLLDQLIHSCAILNQEEPYLQLCLQGSPSPKIRMNDNVVDFVGLAVQRLLFPILRVIFPKVHLDQKQNKFCKKKQSGISP